MSGNRLVEFSGVVHAQLGNAPDDIEPGRLHRFSTNGKHGNKSGWCRLSDDGRAGVYGDFRSGVSLVWSATRRNDMTHAERTSHLLATAETKKRRQAEQQAEYATNAKRNNQMWAETVAVTAGDPVAQYLRNRGLAGPVPECLRLHQRAIYWEEGERSLHPAMIAPMVSREGHLLALHRTFLTADGHKAPVSTVKKVTGTAGPLVGTRIPLFQPKDGVIGVAEGIETALAANLASRLPTVAAYSAGALAGYVWPRDVNRIVIFADADTAGATAAQALKKRALHSGLNVNVMAPPTPGTDWCDVLARHGAARSIKVQSHE